MGYYLLCDNLIKIDESLFEEHDKMLMNKAFDVFKKELDKYKVDINLASTPYDFIERAYREIKEQIK